MIALRTALLLLLITICLIAVTKTVVSQCSCLLPSDETSENAGQFEITRNLFNQRVTDYADNNFDGRYVQEFPGDAPDDRCKWEGSQYENDAGLSGGPPGGWQVNGGQVAGQHNHWGYDKVGWTSQAVDYFRQNGPAHNVQFPCATTVYQDMGMWCPSYGGLWQIYLQNNVLSSTVDAAYGVVNCRRGTCASIPY